jgi:HrpA-like RNA helicase
MILSSLASYRQGVDGIHSDVVIISAETGSGKTTQLPQMLLDVCDDGGCGSRASLVCLQPRRIAAICMK